MDKKIYVVGLFVVAGLAYYIGSGNSETTDNNLAEGPALDNSIIKNKNMLATGIAGNANNPNSAKSSASSSSASVAANESKQFDSTGPAENQGIERDTAKNGHAGPLMVDPNSPLSYKYTFDQEERSESWAAPSERSLTESVQHHQFGNRYKVESIECKTTLCITKVSIPASETNSQLEAEFGWYGIVHSMRQSELGKSLAEYETAVYLDKSDPPMMIYESTFIKQNKE